jgi:hypothetical protein
VEIFMPESGCREMLQPFYTYHDAWRFRSVSLSRKQARKMLRKAGCDTRKFAFYGDHTTIARDACSGHDAMEMRMKMQALVPSVEHYGEAIGGSTEPAWIRVGRQFEFKLLFRHR